MTWSSLEEERGQIEDGEKRDVKCFGIEYTDNDVWRCAEILTEWLLQNNSEDCYWVWTAKNLIEFIFNAVPQCDYPVNLFCKSQAWEQFDSNFPIAWLKTEEGWVQVDVLWDNQHETHIVKKSTPRFTNFSSMVSIRPAYIVLRYFTWLEFMGLFGLHTFASPTISSTDGPSLSQTHVVRWNGKQTKLWKEKG